jgi:hypothetical protein
MLKIKGIYKPNFKYEYIPFKKKPTRLEIIKYKNMFLAEYNEIQFDKVEIYIIEKYEL